MFKEAVVAYSIKLKSKKWFLNTHMSHKLWKALLYCAKKIFLKDNNFIIFSFKICMKACLLQISGYKQLYLDVESVRKRPYDSDNLQHEKLLLKVSFIFCIWSYRTLEKEIRLQLIRSVCKFSRFIQPSRFLPLGKFYDVGERFLVNYFYNFLISIIQIY